MTLLRYAQIQLRCVVPANVSVHVVCFYFLLGEIYVEQV